MRPKINITSKLSRVVFLERLYNMKTTQMLWYRKPLDYCPVTKQFFHPKGVLIIHLN
jgi:hypothetical protein